MDFYKNPTRLLLLLAGLQLTACSFSPSRILEDEDSAPSRYVDVSQIPDAVPRDEPRSPYGNPVSYEVYGERYYVMDRSDGYVERGIASWYGTKFHGRRTSSGEPYDMYAMTAAHKTLPLPTYVRVTNLRNGHSVVVRVNDRGPFVKDRIIDLSYAAARKLGVTGHGTAPVEVRVVGARAPEPEIIQVRPAPMSPPPVAEAIPEPAVPAASQLFLQVGAFSNRINAEQLRQQLLQMALPQVRIETGQVNRQTVYRVWVGPLASESEALQVSERLAQRGHDSRVVLD